MLNDEIRHLAKVIANPHPEKNNPTSEFFVGTISATSPLTLTLADGTAVAGVKRLASYTTPAVADVVRFEKYGPTLLILGKIV